MTTGLGVNGTPTTLEDLPLGESYILIGGVWKQISEVYIVNSGVWKAVDHGYILISSSWENIT